jgi:deoxyribose-phosphate aldolase
VDLDDDAAVARHAIGLVDLTDLGEPTDAAAVDRLCARARAAGTAAVCVWPEYVALCVDRLAGSGVRVATVVNFPSGDFPIGDVVELTRHCIGDGADEIDVVLPYRALLAGDDESAAAVIDAVDELAPTMKVILETGELPDRAAVDRAARFAIAHGADFVKTSTGKTPVSATPEAVATMLDAIADADRSVGVKPSGGIRTLDDARRYLHLAESTMGEGWTTPATFRFGASGLLDALEAAAGD